MLLLLQAGDHANVDATKATATNATANDDANANGVGKGAYETDAGERAYGITIILRASKLDMMTSDNELHVQRLNVYDV